MQNGLKRFLGRKKNGIKPKMSYKNQICITFGTNYIIMCKLERPRGQWHSHKEQNGYGLCSMLHTRYPYAIDGLTSWMKKRIVDFHFANQINNEHPSKHFNNIIVLQWHRKKKKFRRNLCQLLDARLLNSKNRPAANNPVCDSTPKNAYKQKRQKATNFYFV